jgi:hypothetical protein
VIVSEHEPGAFRNAVQTLIPRILNQVRPNCKYVGTEGHVLGAIVDEDCIREVNIKPSGEVTAVLIAAVFFVKARHVLVYSKGSEASLGVLGPSGRPHHYVGPCGGEVAQDFFSQWPERGAVERVDEATIDIKDPRCGSAHLSSERATTG